MARSTVRKVRGAAGEGRAIVTESPSPFTTKNFVEFPEGKTHGEKWGPVVISGPLKVLVLADLHIPYHDRGVIMAALKYGKEQQCDTILLNGDVADFYACSFWQTDPGQRDLNGELKAVRMFLAGLRGEFPKARIIFKLGNHEERWKRFIIQKAPEVYGVDEFQIKALLQLDKFKIELVEDNRLIRLGDLNVLHGHEYRFAITNPVNPARGLFLRCKSYALAGHFHQVSHHSEQTVEGNSIATWSTGALCQLNPEYRRFNNWSAGFAFVEVSEDGKFQVQNKVIKNGKLY